MRQSILVNAAVQGDSVSQDDAEEIWQWMKGEPSFAALPPLKRAELIRALAIKARNPAEIRAMAIPIAQLALIFECEATWLAPRFDQLLRLAGAQRGRGDGIGRYVDRQHAARRSFV